MRRAALRGAAAWLAALLAGAAAGESRPCLQYEAPGVVLEGELHMAVLPGPPHYRAIEEGDQAEVVWLLSLAAPVCMQPVAGEEGSALLTGIASVQVVPRTPLPAPWSGRRVRVQGSLFAPRGGHPRAPLALRAAHAEVVAPEAR